MTRWAGVLLGVVLLLGNVRAWAERAVIDNERGMCYTAPAKGEWGKIGGYLGMPLWGPFWKMQPEAFKGVHGRLQHFGPEDQDANAYFPYAALKSFEADEVAQGRPPIFVTASYQGKQRPVLFSWILPPEGGGFHAQAVNVGDERFIRFFINNYAWDCFLKSKPVRFYSYQNMDWASYQNMWVGLDNGLYSQELYGVLDDAGKYVPRAAWDKPFPQNEDDYVRAVGYALRRIHELAPDIRLLINGASLQDMSKYAETFGTVDGFMQEAFPDRLLGSNDLDRHEFYQQYIAMTKHSRDKLQLYQVSGAADEARMRTAYLAYCLFRGDNAFFGPVGEEIGQEGVVEVAPERYAAMKNALGSPVGPPQDRVEPGAKNDGFRLYWRPMEGGIVYINDSGKAQTIDLPTGREFFDANGKPVTAITVLDHAGEYVLFRPGLRAAKPTINPRRPGLVTGPITVTIEAASADATIHYTTDGSEPDANSAVYSGPITLINSAVVKANCFAAGGLESFTNVASYTLSDVPPRVEFHLSGESGSESSPVFALIQLSHASAQIVSVRCQVTGGSATGDGVDYGSCEGQAVYFQPGDIYRYVPLHIIDDRLAEPDETIELTLTKPENATLGERSSYTYTIIDNDAGRRQR